MNKGNLKILFVTLHYFFTFPRTIRTQNFHKELEKLGIQSHILCFEPFKETQHTNKNIHFIKIPKLIRLVLLYGFDNPVDSKLVLLIIKIINFLIKKLLYPDINVLLTKPIAQHIKYLNKVNNFNKIVFSFYPFSPSKTFKYFDQNLRNKIVCDIGDPLWMNSCKRISKRNFNFENKLVNRSKFLITTNEETRKYYFTYFNKELESIKVIPQGFNQDIFKPDARKSFSFGKYNLIYAGVFYDKLRDPKPLLNFIKENGEQLNINIKIVGSDKFFKQTSQIKFIKRTDQRDLVGIYSKANLLVFIDNAFGMQTSGKIFELLSLKIPILFLYSNSNSPVIKLLKNKNLDKNVFYVENKEAHINRFFLKLKDKVVQQNAISGIEKFSWANLVKNKLLPLMF